MLGINYLSQVAVDRPSNKVKVKVAGMASVSTTINSPPKMAIAVKVS